MDDIGCQVWPNVNINDGWNIQLINRCSKSQYQKVFKNECAQRRGFYNLALLIRDIRCSSDIKHIKQYLRDSELEDIADATEYRYYLEKVFLEISLNVHLSPLRAGASLLRPSRTHLCATIVQYFKINTYDDDWRAFHEMETILSDNDSLSSLLFDDEAIAFHRLRNVFNYGMKEMKRTNCKYNRYMRFALSTLREMVTTTTSQSSSSDPISSRNVQGFWSIIPSWILIEDYLKFPLLRSYEHISVHITDLLLSAAIKPGDGNINFEPLFVMRQQTELTFNFESIMQWLLAKQTDIESIMKILRFIVEQNLMGSRQMYSRLNSYNDLQPNQRDLVQTVSNHLDFTSMCVSTLPSVSSWL